MINISKNLLIFLGAFILVFVAFSFVLANTGSNPAVMGHSVNEISPPENCGVGQALIWTEDGWICGSSGGSGGDAVSDFYIEGQDAQSVEFTNGLIMKFGFKSKGGSDIYLSFEDETGSSFPNEVIYATASWGRFHTKTNHEDMSCSVRDVTNEGMRIRSYNDVYWMAIGH